jgi:hypothetical protein
LFSLYKDEKIALDQALVNADSANNLRLKIKLAGLKIDEEPKDSVPEAQKSKPEPLQAASGRFSVAQRIAVASGQRCYK